MQEKVEVADSEELLATELRHARAVEALRSSRMLLMSPSRVMTRPWSLFSTEMKFSAERWMRLS
eukprot:1116486-Rhodomonas_salina.4